MRPIAYALAKNASMGRHSRIAVLVLSRGMSRTSRNLRLSSTKTPKKQLQKPIHSSAKTKQSSATATGSLHNMEQQMAQGAGSSIPSASTPKPSTNQLRILFTASAVPMIGFGFMDNLVMIQAGQFIDNTIGVTMGLATMTAAAAGQVVSDVSGVIFGGSLERFLHRYQLIKSSSLTSAQRALPVCRNVALFGAVCGVALGCGLGASCLMVMDLKARERAEQAIQLQAVLNDMMMETAGSDDQTVQCESCTIHLTHAPAEKHFITDHTKTDGKTKIDLLPNNIDGKEVEVGKLSLAVQAAHGGKSVMNDSGSVLCTPILSEEGETVAVLEFHSKIAAVHGFSAEDEKAAKVMARHIGIFMHRLRV